MWKAYRQRPHQSPTWWWRWCCRSRCRGSWCSRRARAPASSAPSPDWTDLWTPCYWSPKYLSAPAAGEMQRFWGEKGERLMYWFWTGTQKYEQTNRDRQTGSEEHSWVNMLGISKMQVKATERAYTAKVWDMEREAALGCKCRCIFTGNSLE